jgi:hypothetical protein
MKKKTLTYYAKYFSKPFNCSTAMILCKFGLDGCPKCQANQFYVANEEEHLLRCGACGYSVNYLEGTFADGSKWPPRLLLLGMLVHLQPQKYSVRNLAKVAKISLPGAQSIVDEINQFIGRHSSSSQRAPAVAAVAPSVATPDDSPLRELIAGSVPAQIVAATACWWMDRTAQVARAGRSVQPV